MKQSERGRAAGIAIMALAVLLGAYYFVWVFCGAWMTPELVRTLRLPPKETGVWLVSCVVATLLALTSATAGVLFCVYADRNGRVPPPPLKR